jgi:hypothetical protein
MATFPWAAATSRTTGISAQSIANGAGYVGSEIDNATNLDDTMDIEVIINCSTAPTANLVLYVYVLYALDGTNYEDGSSSQVPVGVPMIAIPARNVTGAQRVMFRGMTISPLKFKILCWNSLGQTSTTTVTAKTYRRGYAA